MRVHVFIATTQGPIAVQRIVAEEPDVQSVICIDGGMEPLSISGRYHDFVRKGSGLIQRDFGEPAYRVDVSGRIDQGNSWQLPVYLAHYLSAEGLLGDGQPQPGDRVVWSTGALKADRSISPVEEVYNKLKASSELFLNLKEQDAPVLVLVPAAESPALDRWLQSDDIMVEAHTDWVCASSDQLDDALRQLCDFIYPEHVGEQDQQDHCLEEGNITQPNILQEPYLPPPGMVSESVPAMAADVATAPQPSTRGGMIWGALILLLIGAGVAGWQYQETTLPAPSLVVEMGPTYGECNQKYMIEQVLVAENGNFPDVSLNRLCAIWIETSPQVGSVVGVSLDNGTLFPIQFSIDRWRMSLPSQRFHSRKYALLVSEQVLTDSVLNKLKSQLEDEFNRDNAQNDTIDPAWLEMVAQKNSIDIDVYTHQLVYEKMSSRDF